MGRSLELRGQRLLALLGVAVIAVIYSLAVPASTGRGHYDHFLFLDTVEYMHDGDGYYRAMEKALADRGVISGRETAYRYPTVFLLWRVVPVDLLWAAFVVVVVVGTAALLSRLTERPFLTLFVAAYLLGASRIVAAGESTESWLLVEFWALPAIAGALVAHRRQRWWLAAGLALLAALTRETTILLLAGGLVDAQLRGRPRLPWVSGLAAFAAVSAAHYWLVSAHVAPRGNDADLFGTGRFPDTVAHIAAWLVPGPEIVGVVLWALALWRVQRLGLAPLLGPLLLLPLAGVLVHRPYWGLLVIPFTILWGLDQIVELASAGFRRVRPAGTAVGGSSPPAGTPAPSAGSPAVERARPSGG